MVINSLDTFSFYWYSSCICNWFLNNSAYGRIWEARKIWSGIVKTLRTFGMYVQGMVTNERTSNKLSEEGLHKELEH